MERSRVVLTVLVFADACISRICGAEEEIKVRPGDDVTLYCDCAWQSGFSIVWFRNCSHEHQPPLVISDAVLMSDALSRYSLVWNPSSQTHDLLVKNVTESDLGLYYCAIHEKTGYRFQKDVYYGNRTSRLSFFDFTFPCASAPQMTPAFPVSDCSVCWKLLVSVCPVCVLLSSVISSLCVYCICYNKIKENLTSDQQEGEKRTKPNEVERDVCYSVLDIPSGGQKRLKKRTENSDFCTYSEVKCRITEENSGCSEF
ncbi:hypothetical protein SRHO_G00248350 [Serrasalmus rhombeus]